jgi:hypothetical protein
MTDALKQTEAKDRLLVALPYLRDAADKARSKGAVHLGILAVQPSGSGQITMRFEADSFFEDLALVLDAPPLTQQDKTAADALLFLHSHGLK